jgi:hypothetical protein
MRYRIHHALRAAGVLAVLAAAPARAGSFARVEDPGTPQGYLARLLINENPFPGERGFISVADSKTGMLSVLHVLDARLRGIPSGYRQSGVAGVTATNIIDLIVAPNQCEGFQRDAKGRPTYAARVEERLNYLLRIANSGDKPGRFAELLNHGQGLATAYMKGGLSEADRFAGLTRVRQVPVTGRAYSWMTDMDCYNPGGNFVKIPDDLGGAPGGNRFYTLRKEPK